jgi:hypothetical protein
VAVALSDDLQVEELAVGQVGVAQGAPIAVFQTDLRVVLHPDPLSVCHARCEGADLLPEALHGLVGVNRFGCIDTNEAQPLAAIED